MVAGGVINTTVRLRKGEDPESLIKRFKKKVSKAGITKEVRDRMYFEKPSDKKRRKKAQSIRNIKREKAKAILREERLAKLRKKNKRKERKKHDGIKHTGSKRQDNRNMSKSKTN